jgi:hypothetical protein
LSNAPHSLNGATSTAIATTSPPQKLAVIEEMRAETNIRANMSVTYSHHGGGLWLAPSACGPGASARFAGVRMA